MEVRLSVWAKRRGWRAKPDKHVWCPSRIMHHLWDNRCGRGVYVCGVTGGGSWKTEMRRGRCASIVLTIVPQRRCHPLVLLGARCPCKVVNHDHSVVRCEWTALGIPQGRGTACRMRPGSYQTGNGRRHRGGEGGRIAVEHPLCPCNCTWSALRRCSTSGCRCMCCGKTSVCLSGLCIEFRSSEGSRVVWMEIWVHMHPN